MGGISDKPGQHESEKPKDAPKSPKKPEQSKKPPQTRALGVIVLYSNSERPHMIPFCDAVNAWGDESSMKITNPPLPEEDQDKSDFMFLKVPLEVEKEKIETWVKKQLEEPKRHIVLVCFLTDYDLDSLKRDTIFQNERKIIPFCFKDSPLQPENKQKCICINVDFENADAELIRDNMNGLGTAILDETLWS